MLKALIRELLFGTPIATEGTIEIAPGAEITDLARYESEAMDTKRIKAIAFLGDKWVLAGTRPEYMKRVRGLV